MHEKKSKKILHVIVTTDTKFGGVSQALKTIITSVSTKEVFHEVVSLDNLENDSFVSDSVVRYHLGPARGPWRYSANLIPWLRTNLPRFDAVIIHGLWLFHSYAVNKTINTLKRLPAKNADVLPKVFVFPHGMLDPYFQLDPKRKLKAVRNYFYWKLIESKVINQADGILFTAERECELARESFTPYQPKKEIIVGLGIEKPPIFISKMKTSFLNACPQATNRRYILFLSRLDQKKGADLLVKAYLKILAKANIQQIPALVIAGPGIEQAFGKKLKKLAAKFENHIFFPGMLEGNAKWGAFYGCEAFILPTHQENFGIAIVEALACSKAVLITDKTNICEEIEKSGGGIIEDDSMLGTTRLLERWLKLSFEEKKSLGNLALSTYERHFTTTSMKTKWLNSII